MLSLLLLAPTLTWSWLATLILILVALGIVFWVLQKLPIPEPFNYVVYGIIALIALWFLFQVVGSLR